MLPSYLRRLKSTVSSDDPAEEPLVGNDYDKEDSLGAARPAVLHPNTSAACRCLVFSVGFWLLLFICIFEAFVIASSNLAPASQNETLKKSPFPPISQVLTLFHNVPYKPGLRTKEAVIQEWAPFDLPHAGFIHLSDPAEFSLRPNRGVVNGTTNVYLVSAYHQLHCLQEIQIAFAELLSALDNQGGTNIPTRKAVSKRHGSHRHPPGLQKNKTKALDSGTTGHTEHCFAYLKQAIMCSGDTTIEGPDPDLKGLHGWGIEHQCRSWDEIEEWMDQHRIH